MEEGDHRAGRFPHDLLDQAERVLRAVAEPDECNVGSFPRRHGTDVLHLDLARDDLMTESRNDRSHERQAILALVRDQDTQMLRFAVTHVPEPLILTRVRSPVGIGRTGPLEAALPKDRAGRTRTCNPRFWRPKQGRGGTRMVRPRCQARLTPL